MSPYRVWHSIKRNFHDYGCLPTLGKLIRRLIAPVYENYTYRIYCIDLVGDTENKAQPNDRFALRLATSDDVEMIRQIEGLAEWLQGEIQDKLNGSHFCVVALDGGTLAGFNLISLQHAHVPVLKLKWALKEDEAWSEQITVDKRYRRQGLALSLRQRAFDELRERGVKKFYGGALKSNRQSLKLAERANFYFTEDIQYIKAFWHKKWYRHEVTR